MNGLNSITNFVRASVLGVPCLFVLSTFLRAQAVPERLARARGIAVTQLCEDEDELRILGQRQDIEG
jgi:hypothetical protein